MAATHLDLDTKRGISFCEDPRTIFAQEQAIRDQLVPRLEHLPLLSGVNQVSRNLMARRRNQELFNFFLTNDAGFFLLPQPEHNHHQIYMGSATNPTVIINMRTGGNTDLLWIDEERSAPDVRRGLLLSVGPDLIHCGQVAYQVVDTPGMALIKEPKPQHYLAGIPSAFPNEDLIENAFGKSNYDKVLGRVSSAAFLTSWSSL